MEEDAESFVAAALRCKKCGLELRLEDAIVRGPHEMWCCECNALYTMLRRHQAWPPAAFAALSDNAQMAFFAKRKKDKEESKKSVFSYKTIRNHLLYTLTAEVTRQRKVSLPQQNAGFLVFFYTQTRLHTEAFAQKSFYTQRLSRIPSKKLSPSRVTDAWCFLHTNALHTEAFTRATAFTRRSLYTWGFYTQKL